MSINDDLGVANPSATTEERALQLFTNRHRIVHHFTRYLNQDSPTNKILFFYGGGGNGKSLLLKFLRNHACKRFKSQVWWELDRQPNFSQALNRYNNPADFELLPVVYHDFGLKPTGDEQPQHPFYGPLMLRRNLDKAARHLDYSLRFPLFDFACLWYLHQKGQLSEERIRQLFPADALNLLSEIVTLIKDVPGVGLAKTLLEIFNRQTGEWFTLYQAQKKLNEATVTRLQSLDVDSELIEEFPKLLADDLNIAITQNKAPSRLVILFDTHEKFWSEKRRTGQGVYLSQDRWLRLFLRQADLEAGIVVVIAGRERPQWAEVPDRESVIPSQYLDSQEVLYLSESESWEYLSKAGITDRELGQAVISYSCVAPDQAHPFLLGLCLDVVEAMTKQGTSPDPEVFRMQVGTERKSEQLINRLLQYVDNSIEYAVQALSACRSFNYSLYCTLGNALHFNTTQPEFNTLRGFSFIWKAPSSSGEENEGIYVLHSLLRRLNDEREQPITRRAHEILESYYRERGEQAEAIYHANRLDWQRGVDEWIETFKQALERSRYEDCSRLGEVRNELNIYGYFHWGLISQYEGDYWCSIARYAEAVQEYQEAIWAYEEKLKQDSDDIYVLNNQGNCLRSLGDLEASLSQVEPARQAYQDAIKSYNRALTLAPDHIYVLNNQGNCLQSLGDLEARLSQVEPARQAYQDAIKSYNRALTLAPDDIYALNNQGNCLLNLSQTKFRRFPKEEVRADLMNALTVLTRSLELAPEDEQIRNLRDYIQEILEQLE